MNLILSGRGVSLNEPLRRYAAEKLTRIERFFDRVIKMEVKLSERNNHEHRAEVTVQTPGETLRAHGDGADHFAAIDKVANRIETQIKRHKARLIDRSHRHTKPTSAIALVDDEPEDGPTIVRMAQQVTKPLSMEEAQLELESRGLDFLLFTDSATMRAAVLYRRADGGYGLIEQAG